MNRHSISIFAVIAFLLLLMPLLVVKAQTLDQCELLLVTTEPENSTWQDLAGSTPDSNFYFMDKLGDWLKLRLFSFTKDARINTLLDQAQERIGELEVLQKQNNLRPNYVNKIVASYNNIMSETDGRLLALQSDGKDITDIMSRVTIISGKNKTIIANILTKSSAQNYQAVQSAYNSTGGSFCEVVDQWVNRENQCNDTILLIQETNDSFNNIAAEIDKINTTKNAIASSYEQANSYIDRVDSINANITVGSINFDAAVDSEAKTFSEKDAILKASLNEFRGDYFYLINNQPEVDSVVNDLIAYSIDSSSNFFAKARASSALMDIKLNNTEISSDIAYIERLMSVDLDEKSVDDMINDLNSAKAGSLNEEIVKVDTLLDDYERELSNLNESKSVCNNLKNDFSDVLKSLQNNRLVQAQNKIKAIYNTANNLDSNYLPGCGMKPVVQTLYDVLVNGNALNPNNSCSSQSYLDSYISQLASWGNDRLQLWDVMVEQHDVYKGEVEAKIGSYQMVKNSKQSVNNNLQVQFSNYSTINTDNLVSDELRNISMQISELSADLDDTEFVSQKAEQDKNASYSEWQTSLNSLNVAQNTATQKENDLLTANENVTDSQTVVDNTRSEVTALESSLDYLDSLAQSKEVELQNVKNELESAESLKKELEVEMQREVELKATIDKIDSLNSKIIDLQADYDTAVSRYAAMQTEYINKQNLLSQVTSNLTNARQILSNKELEYEDAIQEVEIIQVQVSAKQNTYNQTNAEYSSVLAAKDSLVNNINSQNDTYTNAIAKAQKLEVIRQELNTFLDEKFSTTVSNYHNSVNALETLSSEWNGVAEQYSALSGYIPQLRTAMNSKDVNQAYVNIETLSGLTNNLEDSEYNAPAYQINNQLDTLNSLYNMRTLGQARIDNIKESVQRTVVNLQSATCSEAQTIYDQGVTDICNSFSIGDYVNTCQVINNLEVQIINTCQTQPYNNCGNGLVDNGEQCDDGNKLSGDGCSSLCQSEITAYCGDGRIQKPNSFGINEECENMPANNINGDGCSDQCTNEGLAVCGDGILQQPNDNNFNEQCDDGNRAVGDGCNNLCQIERDTLRTIKINKTIP